jgi:Glu-tRNA(Gln) amidotransferase subunit E-like FAD-binding protein
LGRVRDKIVVRISSREYGIAEEDEDAIVFIADSPENAKDALKAVLERDLKKS